MYRLHVLIIVNKGQVPVVQKLDSAIHRINLYPVDKYQGNKLRYPLDKDLFGGQRYPAFEQLGPDLIQNKYQQKELTKGDEFLYNSNNDNNNNSLFNCQMSQVFFKIFKGFIVLCTCINFSSMLISSSLYVSE